MNRIFTLKEASRILSVSEKRLAYFCKIGLVKGISKDGRLFGFDFKGLSAIKRIKELQKQGIGLKKIKTCIQRLKKYFPYVEEPLSEIRIFVDGKTPVLMKDNLKFTPSGQLLIDFEKKEGELVPLSCDVEEELFLEALRLEEEDRIEEAQKKYKEILRLDPSNIDALVNMGNLFYLKGEIKEAEACYRRSLMINPDHLEANYNFANLLCEKGDFENAILFYRKALYEDPFFSDACFNIAIALEKVGNLKDAKFYWLRFLELEPEGELSEFVKRHLDELSL